MPLVAMKDMVNHATHNGYALGGFHIFNLDALAAVMAAAEACRAPIILGINQQWAQSADIGMLLAAAEHAAQRAAVPVSLHYEHGTGLTGAEDAIRCGCNGVSVDGLQLALPERIELARQVVEMAGGCGIPVEGLVGCIAADRREETKSDRPRIELVSVDETRAYVERSGVDFLALSAETDDACQGKGKPDMQRLARIKEAVSVPLTLYGGNTLNDDQIRRVVAQGIAVVNFTTNIEGATTFTTQGQGRDNASVASAMQQARNNMQEFAQERMRTIGSAGRAAEVLLHCKAWEPVEHVIVFNVDTAASLDINTVLAQGRQVLSEIPGVRYVYTGQAVQSGAAYRFCWLVRFVHPAVIDSYREHPVHKKFADELFRPIAPARMSIDFQITTAINTLLADGHVSQTGEDATTAVSSGVSPFGRPNKSSAA